MVGALRKVFRQAYYLAYGRAGKGIRINEEDYTVSAYVARGISSVIDEVPLKLLTNLCKDANLAFDIGGNIGVIAMILSKKMKPGSVIYSFEPAPLSFKYLKDNARVQKGNATIIPINLAAGNSNDPLYFTNDGNSCTNHISAASEPGTITVGSTTIDHFCTANSVIPQVIKIDIEGAEYWALQGMAQTLKDNDCTVLVEIHQVYLQDNHVTGQMFSDLINSIGYSTFSETGEEIAASQIIDNTCVILSRTTPPASVFKIS